MYWLTKGSPEGMLAKTWQLTGRLIEFLFWGWIPLRALRPVERLRFPFSHIRTQMATFFKPGLIGGLIGGLVFGLVGVILGLTAGITTALVLLVATEAVETRGKPNQGTRNSIKNSLILMVSFGAIFALIGVLISGLSDGMIYGLIGGLIFGLVGGGLFSLKHFGVRLVLWIDGSIPINYVRFLDYAVERVFLRKVGGGYIFVHRMLMEYFASVLRYGDSEVGIGEL